jgi:hypothetical protein
MISIISDKRGRVDGSVPTPRSLADPAHLVHGGEPAGADPFGVHRLKVPQRHDRGHRHARPFHDEPLTGRGLVQDLPEPGANVEGTDRSHGAMIDL